MSISLREESGGLLNDAEWSLTANHPKEKGKQLQEKKKRIFQEEAEWIMVHFYLLFCSLEYVLAFPFILF